MRDIAGLTVYGAKLHTMARSFAVRSAGIGPLTPKRRTADMTSKENRPANGLSVEIDSQRNKENYERKDGGS